MKLIMENWKKYANKEIKEGYDGEEELKQMISKRSSSSYVKQILNQEEYFEYPRMLESLLNDIYRHDRQKHGEVLELLFSEIGKKQDIAHKLITDKRFLDVLRGK